MKKLSKVKAAYEGARAEAIEAIGNYCKQEMTDMTAIAEVLR